MYVWWEEGELGMPDCGMEEEVDEACMGEGGEVCPFLEGVSANDL